MQRTEPPRTEAPSRGATIFTGILATIVLLFVAGVLGIALVWLARVALGG
jgi:hypothetical protein